MISIETPLGIVGFYASHGTGREPMGCQVSIETRAYVPSPFRGTTVEHAEAVLFTVSASASVMSLELGCRWLTAPPLEFGPETGEALEAQSWSDERFLVMVGTEDAEVLTGWDAPNQSGRDRVAPDPLAGRLPRGIALRAEPRAYSYAADRLSLTFSSIPADAGFSLHFIVAWNPLPEVVPGSCWLAVDARHRDVVRLLGGARPTR